MQFIASRGGLYSCKDALKAPTIVHSFIFFNVLYITVFRHI